MMKDKNAATNNQKQRMNIQLNQISRFISKKGSILTDFRKVKFKCIDISKAIGEQMQKQVYFKNIQKSTLRKMDLLDLPGLVSLKNQLVKALTELFDIERQLMYKKQKHDAKKIIMQQQAFNFKNKFQSQMHSPRNNKPSIEQHFKSIVSEPKVQKKQSPSPAKPKNKGLQIPLYRAKTQTNENKLDRISKYIAALKKNMKINTQSIGYKWKIKQFLMEDQNFLSIRTQIQKYQMREQQIDFIISKQIEKGVRSYLGKAQIIEGTPTYKLVRIYKKQAKQSQMQVGQKNIKTQSANHNKSILLGQLNHLTNNAKQTGSPRIMGSPRILGSPRIMGSPRQMGPAGIKTQGANLTLSALLSSPKASQINSNSKINIQDKVSQDFNSIKKQLEKSSQNYAQILTKINQIVEKGSEKLIQMREKRKKKSEKDDDIWGELDNI